MRDIIDPAIAPPVPWPLPPPRRTMRQIVQDYATAHGVTLEDLRSPARHKPLVLIRWGAMNAVKENTKLSLPQIGRYFNRDHTSVLHGIRRVRGATARQAKASRSLAQQEAAA